MPGLPCQDHSQTTSKYCNVLFGKVNRSRPRQIFKGSADAKGGDVAAVYSKVAWTASLVWLVYPVVWLFSEGFGSFSVSFEITAYAILDVCMKSIVCFTVMSAQDAIGGDDAGREYV